jgi:hypothetical protein
MGEEYLQVETEVNYTESGRIRWVLPTSQGKFINRLKDYINRLPAIRTSRGTIDFSRIAQRSNGIIEILGDWHVDGQLQDRHVEMLDLTISELEADRIEVTFESRILLPDYAAYRNQLAAMIDAGYPGTRMTQLAKPDQVSALEVVLEARDGKIYRVRGPADSPLMHRLAQGQVPKELSYRPWRPFFETYISTTSDAVLDVVEHYVSQYRVSHPELLRHVSFRRNGLRYVMVDHLWPIIDVDIVADDDAQRIGLRLALVEYDDDSEIPNARELQALARDVGYFLRDEVVKLYGRPNKPQEMSMGGVQSLPNQSERKAILDAIDRAKKKAHDLVPKWKLIRDELSYTDFTEDKEAPSVPTLRGKIRAMWNDEAARAEIRARRLDDLVEALATRKRK